MNHMNRLEKYAGIFPAFYACYDDEGNVSPERISMYARALAGKGVQGLYVGGSSGECIYLSVEERKRTLESVMDAVGGKLRIIAHVACNNTRDSMELAAHAEANGVDAIAAIPPIYFRLPPHAICEYWNDISSAAPSTDFIIYNIPQLAGVSLTLPMLAEMKKNARLAGVKNSSPSAQDIQQFRDAGGADFVVFNGPDEQLLSGLAAGATGGIGGTYGVMPELYLLIWNLFSKGEMERARMAQNEACRIIYTLLSAKGNIYAVMKAILEKRGMPIGGARKPLPKIAPEDEILVERCLEMIRTATGESAV